MADCTRPPEGWTCTREAGHDGPCAAALTGNPGWKPRPDRLLTIHTTAGSVSHTLCEVAPDVWREVNRPSEQVLAFAFAPSEARYPDGRMVHPSPPLEIPAPDSPTMSLLWQDAQLRNAAQANTK